MKTNLNITKKQKELNEKIANDLKKFIQSIDCWIDVCIFYNGKAISSNKKWNKWEGVLIEESKDEFGEVMKVYEYDNIESPKYWTQYANEETVTVLFDGAFYEWLHYYGDWSKLEKILTSYGAYFEFGNMNDLSIYFN